MKYKVGDRVKVRSDLEVGEHYGKHTIVRGMHTQLGRVVTITGIVSDGYKIAEDDGDYYWTDEMFAGLAAGGCIYAYDLMKLAAENPEAYKDKKYKVAKGNCMNGYGDKPMAVLVRPSGILADESTYQIYVTSETILEEIKPAPQPVQPVPFTEAVKAYSEGKTISCEINNKLQHGTWYIKEN